MNLYLDDDTVAKKLVARLRKAGHNVVLPIDAGLSGVTDPRHFVYAIRQSLLLLTRNRDDFVELHEVVAAANGQHPGIFVICQDNDPTRDMTERGIVTAIGKIEKSGVPLVSQLYVLNHWR